MASLELQFDRKTVDLASFAGETYIQAQLEAYIRSTWLTWCNMSTKITPFRLSDNTLANIDEAITLMKDEHKATGTEWMVRKLSRTDVVKKAIDYYLSHLIQRKRAAKTKGK